MKKQVLILLTAVLLVLSSCENTAAPTSTSSEDTAAHSDSSMGSTVKSEDSVSNPDSTEDSTSAEENVFPFPVTDPDPGAAEYPPKTYTASVLPGKKKVSGKLAEELGVPEHVEGTFISPSGVSQVYLNADVVFPDIDHVNIYKAVPRIFTQEEIDYFADCFKDETDYFNDGESWFYVENHQPWRNAAPAVRDTYDHIDTYHLWLNNLPVQLDLPLTYNEDVYKENLIQALKAYMPEDQAEAYYTKELSIRYYLGQGSGELARGDPELEYKGTRQYSMIYPLENGRASGTSLTLEQAVSAADEAVQGILPDFGITAYGQTGISDYLPQSVSYCFIYTRHLDGIPINDPGNFGASDQYGYVSNQEKILMVVGDKGVEYFRYNSPFSVGEMVTENAALLPFSEIQEIYEKMLLLSIQYYEINNEDLKQNLRHIYEVRFGYMAVFQNDGTYLYTPVWDFYGTQRLAGTGGYGKGDTIPAEFEDPVLTLNAVTGEVIDRGLGY